MDKLVSFVKGNKVIQFVWPLLAAGFIISVIDIFMSILSEYMIDYLVIAVTCVLGLLGMLLWLKLPNRTNRKAWFLLASIWAGAVTIIYAHQLKEHSIEPGIWGPWTLIGLALVNIPIGILLISSHFEKKRLAK